MVVPVTETPEGDGVVTCTKADETTTKATTKYCEVSSTAEENGLNSVTAKHRGSSNLGHEADGISTAIKADEQAAADGVTEHKGVITTATCDGRRGLSSCREVERIAICTAGNRRFNEVRTRAEDQSVSSRATKDGGTRGRHGEGERVAARRSQWCCWKVHP